jgi:thymidylate synthase ThyX
MSDYLHRFIDEDLKSYRLQDKCTGIKVGTLTQGSLNEQRAALIGMSLAKFSRSSDSLIDNAKSIVDAASSMEKIAVGYGHASVSGMAHINFHVEDVSILDSLKFFYSNNLVDGQERSTRYQEFDKFMAIPSTLGSNSIRNKYKDIVRTQLSNYKDMFAPTKKELASIFPSASDKTLSIRTLDCTRYLIPLAVKTSFGAVTSSRSLAQYIKQLSSSIDPVQTKLGELLLDMFTSDYESYKSECSFLIKYLDPEVKLNHLTGRLLEIHDKVKPSWAVPENEPSVSSCFNESFSHLLKLINPSIIEPQDMYDYEELIGDILSLYSHHDECPSYLKEGLMSVYGFLDIGSIKDLNRHRSIHKLVPFFHESTSMFHELVTRPLNKRFFICPYLNYNSELLPLSEEYYSLLKDTYKQIEEWYLEASQEIGAYADLYAKRLVPQAHATTFVYSGSYPEFNYLTSLRNGNGGHIQYRMTAYSMLKSLKDQSPVFKALLNKLTEPDPTNEEQFNGRS